MAWENFMAKGKLYRVNWDGVTHIIRSGLHSKGVWENSSVKYQKAFEGDWFEKAYGIPEVATVEVDWKKVREAKETGTEPRLRRFYDIATGQSMDHAVKMLADLLAQARGFDDQYGRRLKCTSTQTMANIQEAVATGERDLAYATHVRDISAELLVVSASFATGGLSESVSLLAMGSGLKGLAKLQDTGGNKTAAVAEFTLTMGFGLIGLKLGASEAAKKLSGAEKLALDIVVAKVQGGLEAPKAWIEGKSIEEGLGAGTFKVGGSSLQEGGKTLTTNLLKSSFKGKLALVALPAQVAFNYSVDKGAGWLAGASKATPKPGPPSLPKPQPDQKLLDAVTPDLDYIEKCAVRALTS